jgi:hypothetical protein
VQIGGETAVKSWPEKKANKHKTEYYRNFKRQYNHVKSTKSETQILMYILIRIKIQREKAKHVGYTSIIFYY